MAPTITHILSNGSATDSATYTTASVTIQPDESLIITVTVGMTTPGAPTLVSADGLTGMTLTSLGDVLMNSNNAARSMILYGKNETGSAITGTVTFTWSDVAWNCQWTLIRGTELAASPLTGNNTAAITYRGAGTAPSATFGSTPVSTSVVIAVAHTNQTSSTAVAGTNFTMIGNGTGLSTPGVIQNTEYDLASATTTVNFTGYTSTFNRAMVAVEIAQAPPSTTKQASAALTATSTLTATATTTGGGGGYIGWPADGQYYIGWSQGGTRGTIAQGQSKSDNKMSVFHMYCPDAANNRIYEPYVDEAIDAGLIPSLSFKMYSKGNTTNGPIDIMNGVYDSQLTSDLNMIKSKAPWPVILCFFHEPGGDFTTTALQVNYRACTRYIVQFARDLGVTNAIWTCILEAPFDFRPTPLTPDGSQGGGRNPRWQQCHADWKGTTGNGVNDWYTGADRMMDLFGLDIYIPMVGAGNTAFIDYHNVWRDVAYRWTQTGFPIDDYDGCAIFEMGWSNNVNPDPDWVEYSIDTLEEQALRNIKLFTYYNNENGVETPGIPKYDMAEYPPGNVSDPNGLKWDGWHNIVDGAIVFSLEAPVLTGSVALTATSTLTATAVRTKVVTAALTATSTLTAMPVGGAAQAFLTATSTLTVGAVATKVGAVMVGTPSAVGVSNVNLTLTWPTGIQSGDRAVLHWMHTTGSTTTTGPDAISKPFNQLETPPVDGTGSLEAWDRLCDGTETGTFTLVRNTTTRHCAVLSVWRDMGPLDQISTVSPTGGDGLYPLPSVTPTVDGGTLLIATSERVSTGSTSATVPTGFTIAGQAAAAGSNGSFVEQSYQGSGAEAGVGFTSGVAINPGTVTHNVTTAVDVFAQTLYFKPVSAPVTQDATVAMTAVATLNASATMTQKATVALTATSTLGAAVTSRGGLPYDVIISSVKQTAIKDHVIVGGVKRPVVGRWVIVGGVKRPVV